MARRRSVFEIPQPLSRKERARIVELFAKNWGSQTKIARRLKVSPSSISLWLKGKTVSSRLDREVPKLLDRLHPHVRGESAA